MSSEVLLRKGVCGIFIRKDKTLLLGERTGEPGQWQLPQGGIEKGETPFEALLREIKEEVGLSGFVPFKNTVEFISYPWPPGLFKSRFTGQEHLYYLIHGDHIDIDKLEPTEEFQRFGWFTVDETLNLIIPWKRDAYVAAFRELGLIK